MALRTLAVPVKKALYGTLLPMLFAPQVLAAEMPAGPDYRVPQSSVVELLTATPPPETVLHAGSGRIALLYREAVIPMPRVARQRLGLAGYRFDPDSGTSGLDPLVRRVEILTIGEASIARRVEWQPAGEAVLDAVRFSPDGRTLSAVALSAGPARLLLFDVDSGREHVLDTPINASWGEPCRWTGATVLLCRVFPQSRGPAPAPHPAPVLVEHPGGAAPLRTYSNLLENRYADTLFEYYFSSGLAAVDLQGRMRRVPGLEGLLYDFEPSPDGAYAVVERLSPPYPRLVPARHFPSTMEVWDLRRGERLYVSERSGFGVETDPDQIESPRRSAWKPGPTNVLGYIDRRCPDLERCPSRWMQIAAPFDGNPEQLALTTQSIRRFGWTSAGTPWFSSRATASGAPRYHAVYPDGVKTLWAGSDAEAYDDQGRALRQGGEDSPVLELGGQIFFAADDVRGRGPRPFLQSIALKDGSTRRLFTAEENVYESVLGVLDADPLTYVTARETETDAPNLYLYRGQQRNALTDLRPPYPQLSGTTRRLLQYRRADGLELSASLYLPAGYREGQRLPTLVWIYPYEFTDRAQAERIDVRAFRYHRVKGPSPLAATLAGYAVLLNPTIPILYAGEAVNDNYLQQLVGSVEAAVDHLVGIGVTDPRRVAVAGRSYGAFSTANLLIHSDRFAAGIAMSGAYNRTLTPYGFQHEHRSFWEATDMYTRISPFFHADAVSAPLLLIHGGADENAGTPPLQTRRFFHALVGEGKPARLVELPYEGHHYWARENVLLASRELLDWLERFIGSGESPP